MPHSDSKPYQLIGLVLRCMREWARIVAKGKRELCD